MAELGEGGGGGHGKHEKKRAKRFSNRVDMTPMVDLGFLLLTFFVLTSTLMEPKTMELTVPAKKDEKDKEKNTKFPESSTINILMTKNNRIYWYMGKPNKDVPPVFNRTTYGPKGLRKVLLEKNARLNAEIEQLVKDVQNKKLPADSLKPEIRKLRAKSILEASGQYGLLAIIKPADDATYKNLVDVFDELNVTNAANFALTKPADWELKIMQMAPQ